MSTKDNHLLSFKDKSKFFEDENSFNQYKNINLNANQKCSKIDLIQSKNISSNFNSSTKKNNNDYASKKALDSIFDEKNKNDFGPKKSNDFNIFDSNKNESNEKQWKKKNDSKSESTLSLHISAYENSVETENEQNYIVSESIKQTKFDKSLKSVLGFSFTLKDLFEIPRQQSDEGPKSEVINFKASQKLLDSKKNSISLSTVSSAPRDIHKNLLTESLNVEEAKAEMHEIVPISVRDVLIKEYEKKIVEFVCKPENLADIQNKIYSRELVLLLREINKNLHLVPCPFSEDELKKIGIDRSTMYTPLPRDQNPKFHGRGRGRSRGGNVNKSLGRNSNFIQKKPSSIRVITAPINKYKNVQEPIDPVDNFRNFIDKLTPATIEQIHKKITEIPYNQISQILPTIAEILFEKAVNDHLFAEVCADLCRIVFIIEYKNEGAVVKPVFHGALIRKCQRSFEGHLLMNHPKSVAEIQKQDETKLAVLNENEKQRMIGIIKFISHLYRVKLLYYKIIEDCIVVLIRNAQDSDNEKELMLEYAIILMETVGPIVFQITEDKYTLYGYVSYLSKFKDSVSNSVQLMIDNLIKLRDQKWIKVEDSAVADATALDTKLGNNAPIVDKEKQPTADVTEAKVPISSSIDETLSFDFEVEACKNAFKMKLKCLQPVDIDELVKLMIEHNSKMKIPTFYLEQIFIYFCENLKSSQENERQTVSKLISKCLQNLAFKNAFGNAFKNYCKRIVETDARIEANFF